MAFLEDGSRMLAPGDNCKDVHEVMKLCWAWQPEKRPRFIELEGKLKTLQAAAITNDS